MSCCEGNRGSEHFAGTGCCGTTCTTKKAGCTASEPRIRSCLCQSNVGCLDRADCGGFRPTGTAATGACPGPCQCIEEEAWNQNVPPKPNCEWLSNFSELRRQWSDHGRREKCKCCNCRPSKTAAPCRPCLLPTPRCHKTVALPSNCQDCCNGRLAGGACGPTSSSGCSSSNSRECNAQSSGTCPSSSCNRPPVAINCTACQPPCSSCCPVSSPCSSPPCQLPSSCQPCAPSTRPILKKRSCCQCIPSGCLCQPTPRSCNCPPPIQIDARADKDCSCNCPSAPECACPPSERRFPRTKVRCPNARECCPLPRLPPGPKCCCTQCQPCLPPPCDPCTSSKCRTVAPVIEPCRSVSPCPPCSPCRSRSPPPTTPCRPIPPCAPRCKIAACRTSNFYQTPSPSPTRSLAHSSSPGGSSCSTPCRGSENDVGEVQFEDCFDSNVDNYGLPASEWHPNNNEVNITSGLQYGNNIQQHPTTNHFQCPMYSSFLPSIPWLFSSTWIMPAPLYFHPASSYAHSQNQKNSTPSYHCVSDDQIYTIQCTSCGTNNLDVQNVDDNLSEMKYDGTNDQKPNLQNTKLNRDPPSSTSNCSHMSDVEKEATTRYCGDVDKRPSTLDNTFCRTSNYTLNVVPPNPDKSAIVSDDTNASAENNANEAAIDSDTNKIMIYDDSLLRNNQSTAENEESSGEYQEPNMVDLNDISNNSDDRCQSSSLNDVNQQK